MKTHCFAVLRESAANPALRHANQLGSEARSRLERVVTQRGHVDDSGKIAGGVAIRCFPARVSVLLAEPPPPRR